MAIEGNMFDGHTLSPQLEQLKEFTHGKLRKAIVDRGYRERQKIGMTDSVMPNTARKESYCMKNLREARCQSRAGIEGLISHLKHDHRLLRNYLKGTVGDQINTLLAAAAYNMRKWMRIKREEIVFFIFRWYFQAFSFSPVNIQSI